MKDMILKTGQLQHHRRLHEERQQLGQLKRCKSVGTFCPKHKLV